MQDFCKVGARIAKLWLVSLLAIVGSPPASQGATAPPFVCEIILGVWCIRSGPSEMTFRPSASEEYQGDWTIRGSFQPEKPLLVREPRGCRNGLSDTMELLEREKAYIWSEQIYDRVRVRLKSDKTCDLEFLLQETAIEKLDEAFSSGLVWIQACKMSSCRGEPLDTPGIFRNTLRP